MGFIEVLRKQAWTIRERYRFWSLRPSLGVCPLGTISKSDLGSIFESKEILDTWEVDQRKIAELGLPEYTGGVNPGDQRAIYYLIRHLRPRTCLEIGTHIGCSTVNIATALQRNIQRSIDKIPELLSVDKCDVNDHSCKLWMNFKSSSSPKEMVDKLGCGSFVKFLVSPSLTFLRSDQRKFDFIFLDGDTSASNVYQEIVLSMQRLSPGGFVLVHNYFPDMKPLFSDKRCIEGPFLATERLIREGWAFRVVPLGNLPWTTKWGSRVTTLAIMSKVLREN